MMETQLKFNLEKEWKVGAKVRINDKAYAGCGKIGVITSWSDIFIRVGNHALPDHTYISEDNFHLCFSKNHLELL